jgi:acetyl esterase/lipase
MNRLRVLCLHGYHGSADTLRAQMRSLLEGLESWVEFVHVDAPSLSSGDFGWWHAVPSRRSPRPGDPGVGTRAMHYDGWDRTRGWAVALFNEQGPFDGVFGFSQGAALSSLLVGLRSPDGTVTPERPLSFNFAMMVGGFLSNDPDHAYLYEATDSFDLPSLHIIGRSDLLVPTEASRALASHFKNAVVLEHEGGHVIASTPDVRTPVFQFLDEMRRRRSPVVADAQEAGSRPITPGPRASVGPVEVPLWPGRPHPSMTLFFPERRGSKPAPAMLVFQGGGYATCFGSGGGSAEWAARHGMVGVRVEYGTESTGEFYPANYSDAARAVRLVRHRAAEWGVDRERVGVMGYSAGGHLASLLSTQPTLYAHPADDLAQQVSARPNLLVLGYPLISFVDQYSPGGFVGSVENFFGRENVDAVHRRQFSNELHVSPGHPPVFLWTTDDDTLVPSTHSKLFAEACRRAKVPVTFKLYPHGPHGMGLALGQQGEVRQWTNLLLEWLRERWGVRIVRATDGVGELEAGHDRDSGLLPTDADEI